MSSIISVLGVPEDINRMGFNLLFEITKIVLNQTKITLKIGH